MLFEEFKGKVFTQINVNEDHTEVTFVTDEGETYLMYHEQDCCESVCLEDVTGDFADLIGSPITYAIEVSESSESEWDESETWTFYNIATMKGWVTLRWFGSSNGYYSEEVYIKKL